MSTHSNLCERVRVLLQHPTPCTEKKMFGGLAFLLHGNMCCGVHKEELIVRFNPDNTTRYLAQPHTRIFDLSGRPMRGWILVAPAGVKNEAALSKWIQIAVDYATSLPPK